ncbi:MAG TPA: MFS transporter [Oculatellaceae cyanobacterium]
MTATTRPRVEIPVVPAHAIIGIVAVSLSAVNSSLGSGLLSVGLEDLRGAWDLGIDDAAYLPTAFNASQMFMGVVSVLLAARFGHRPVLLFAGTVYAIACLVLPLVAPHIVPLTLILMIAGMASGTFYPLCLSFISRNLPLSLVTYGVAAYNLDLLATNHMTQLLEGLCILNASWHWLFWSQALLALPMLLCVHRGIPDTPKDQLLPKFNWSGVFYVSGALSLFYIALDQGERLDWYNNGLINGLVLAGVLLLVAAVIHRKFAPNPFLDFEYVRKRNILLLGFLMLAFRTLLVRVNFIIPVFLETMHQYRPTETGALFALSVIPFMVALPIVAFLMRNLHVRYVLLIGFASLALINFRDAHALSTWMLPEFVWTQMLGAAGICMVAMGVIAGMVFAGRQSGAYRNRAGAYAQGALFQAARLFASVSSVSAFRRYLLFREHFWQTKLTTGLQPAWTFDQRSSYLGVALAPQAAAAQQARDIGVGLIAHEVRTQSFTLAIDDTFMLMAWVCIIGLVALSLMVKIPLPRDLPAVGEENTHAEDDNDSKS